MKQVVHKSVIPLYAAAATWLLYALLFPLYKLPHFLLAATASAVVGIVARMFCRDTVEEVPEEPVSTGNQELDKMIADGKKAIAEMKRLDDSIADPTISAQIVRLQELSGKIFAQVEATMQKVETMMSTIVTAFERQLDSLFGSEAMDISSDMVVLENLMAREGLTEDQLHRAASGSVSAEAVPPQHDRADGGITLEL